VTFSILPGEFYVADDGAGIPRSAHDKVFEMGYSTYVAGASLGLPTVKYIASTRIRSIAKTEGKTDGARSEVWNALVKQLDSKPPVTNDSP